MLVLSIGINPQGMERCWSSLSHLWAMFSDLGADEQLRAASTPLSKAEKIKLFASKHIGMKMNCHSAKGFSKWCCDYSQPVPFEYFPCLFVLLTFLNLFFPPSYITGDPVVRGGCIMHVVHKINPFGMWQRYCRTTPKWSGIFPVCSSEF